MDGRSAESMVPFHGDLTRQYGTMPGIDTSASLDMNPFGISRLGFGMVPAFIGIIYFVEICTIFVVATANGDMNNTIPFITSAAEHRPQSCIFSLCTNLICFLLFVMVFVRHRQCRAFYTADYYWRVGRVQDNVMIMWNNITRICGFVAATGWFIIANVQKSGIPFLHVIGTHTAYGVFTIYMAFQVWISRDISRQNQRKSSYYVRFMLTILSLVFYASFVFFELKVSYSLLLDVLPGSVNNTLWFLKVQATNQDFRQAQVAAEYACVFVQMVFIMSYYSELEKVQLKFCLMSEYVDMDEVRRVRDFYNYSRGRYRL